MDAQKMPTAIDMLHDTGNDCVFCGCRLGRLLVVASAAPAVFDGHQMECAGCGSRGPVCDHPEEALSAWKSLLTFLQTQMLKKFAEAATDIRHGGRYDPRINLISVKVDATKGHSGD